MKSQPQDNDKYLFGIVVFDYEDYKIDKTINSLKCINYDKEKYKIVLSSKNNKQASELFGYIQDFKQNSVLSELVITLSEYSDIETEAYTKCIGATHLVKIKAGDSIDSNLFKEISELIDENSKLVAFEKNNVKIIEYNTANDSYLKYKYFDDLFESLKQKELYKNLNEK